MLFNLFVICFYQNTLIFLFTLPVLTLLVPSAIPFNGMDYTLAGLIVFLVYIEYTADQQQYDFQTEKYRRINAGADLGPYAAGFVSTGLWAKVRHPNYAAEQSIWIVFYLLGAHATGEWINWSIAGAVLLSILFKGSSDFSEEISANKYPLYKEYLKKVGRFIPKL
jgi:steroid 5-alpha reductase family enzyme